MRTLGSFLCHTFNRSQVVLHLLDLRIKPEQVNRGLFRLAERGGHHLGQIPNRRLEPVLCLSLAVRELRGLPDVGAVVSDAINNYNSTEGQQTLWTDLSPVWERVADDFLSGFGGRHGSLSKLGQQ